MLPIKHFILGVAVAVAIYFLFPEVTILGLVIIVLSNVLIDVDHYVYHAVKKKDLSLVRAYKWYQLNRVKTHHLSRKEKSKIYFGFHFFHGIEILAIIYLLYAYVNNIFFYVMIGYSLHFVSDLITEAVICGKVDKISVIYSFFRMNKLKFVDELEVPKNPLMLKI